MPSFVVGMRHASFRTWYEEVGVQSKKEFQDYHGSVSWTFADDTRVLKYTLWRWGKCGVRIEVRGSKFHERQYVSDWKTYYDVRDMDAFRSQVIDVSRGVAHDCKYDPPTTPLINLPSGSARARLIALLSPHSEASFDPDDIVC